VAGPIAEELTVSIFARNQPRRQAPPRNKDNFRPASIPQLASSGDDGPDWPDLDDVLEELGLSLRQFRAVYPHVGLEHRGLHGQVIIDANQLEEGGCR
jgi:hypothetical protein